MFNNRVQNGKSEFQNFMEGQDKKLKIGISKRIYCEYAFFIYSSDQDNIMDVVSIISKNISNVSLTYDMIEQINNNSTKVTLKILFEGVSVRPKTCFLNIANFLTHMKAILDKYSKDIAKEFSMNISFFVKRIEDYNTVLVKYLNDDEIVEYKEKMLPKNFSKYTTHINYNINTFKNIISLTGSTGNIDGLGFAETFYEIVNNIIQFNNEIVCNMK